MKGEIVSYTLRTLFGMDNIPYSRPGAPNDRYKGKTLCSVGIVGDFAQHGFQDADVAV